MSIAATVAFVGWREAERQPWPAAYEAGLLTLVWVSTAAGAWALHTKEARVASGVALWALATRLAAIGLGLPMNAGVTVAWTAVLTALLATGFVRRLPELRQLGLAVAGVTAAKVVLIDLSGLEPALKAVLLLALGLVLLVAGYAYVRAGRAKGNLGP